MYATTSTSSPLDRLPDPAELRERLGEIRAERRLIVKLLRVMEAPPARAGGKVEGELRTGDAE